MSTTENSKSCQEIIWGTIKWESSDGTGSTSAGSLDTQARTPGWSFSGTPDSPVKSPQTPNTDAQTIHRSNAQRNNFDDNDDKEENRVTDWLEKNKEWIEKDRTNYQSDKHSTNSSNGSSSNCGKTTDIDG